MTHNDALPFLVPECEGHRGGAHRGTHTRTPAQEHVGEMRHVRHVRHASCPVALARLVAEIADRVARLSPSHRDPEAFHMDKHTLASELRALARAMEAA